MSLSTLAAVGEQLLGRQLLPGDRIQIVNMATGEVRWSGRITHFAVPRRPKEARNARQLPRNTRIAFAGPTCLGPVPDNASVLVDRPTAKAA